MSTNIWLLIKLNPIDKYHEGKIYIVTIECNKEFVEPDIEYLEVVYINIVLHSFIFKTFFKILFSIIYICLINYFLFIYLFISKQQK